MLKRNKKILGVYISAINYFLAINTIKGWIISRQKQYVCVAAVHLVMECQKNAQLVHGVNQSALVTPDGMPLVWLLRLYGKKNVSRVYGPTLMEKLCTESIKLKWRIFLLGGTSGQGSRLVKALNQRCPGIKITGSIDTPIRPITSTLNKKIIRLINKQKPEIVFIGLGCPWQEKWMIENRKKLNANVLIGVGAAFDFLSGDKKQAPIWLQNIGLEWLFRLFQEPKRLWYRYSVLNLKFMFLTLRQLTRDFLLQ